MTPLELQHEQSQFDKNVARIEGWWKSPRQRHLRRTYSAASVAALRSTIQHDYISSTQARKLWTLLNEHRAEKTVNLTFGTTDPLQAVVMARSLSTVYVSGGIAGMNEAQYPGIDHADYVSPQCPNKATRVEKNLF